MKCLVAVIKLDEKSDLFNIQDMYANIIEKYDWSGNYFDVLKEKYACVVGDLDKFDTYDVNAIDQFIENAIKEQKYD